MTQTIKFDFHLVLSRSGAVRTTKGWPGSVARDERVMKMHAELPASLFVTPELTANIVIPDPGQQPFNIDVEGVSKMLSEGTGLDVKLQLVEPQS